MKNLKELIKKESIKNSNLKRIIYEVKKEIIHKEEIFLNYDDSHLDNYNDHGDRYGDSYNDGF